ncbi:4-oxalocrotonate tautomerase family protein [Rhizobium wenxiniae]|uniref:tautomerase family protein n=1 Tax=Rhizobium wenxiniae TaxID=1737357 RepID=UPI001C6EBDDE|nr:4-oxalocrotonate tautomerase family protein [Rhizobium wenxiniae]MBW9088244.1 4-oxalocrotonate tautomerase family protein [Rhizobium wenxiniae]
MPILNVKVSGQRSDEMTHAIASMLSELTQRILGKDPAVTAIAIDYVDPRDWIVGGRTLAEQRKSSVYFDIKITDETNTKSEKAAYIQAAFEGFASLLGNLHEESYIYVQDVRAAAYGYGGKTQEWRYQRAV